MDVQTLKDLGLDKAAETLDKKLALKKKLAIAYEHFRFVEPHVLDRFAAEMKKNTFRVEQHNQYQKTEYWRALKFIPLNKYGEIPPPDCLMDLKKAKEMGCFDSFEVAKVEEVSNYSDSTPVPDPIIFGGIEGCADKFFITQWDDDVSIEQILNENEG